MKTNLLSSYRPGRLARVAAVLAMAAIGIDARAVTDNVARGNGAATGNDSTAIGSGATARTGDFTFAVGDGAIASGKASFAMGSQALSFPGNNYTNTQAIGDHSFAFGADAVAAGESSFAFGTTVNATAGFAVAIGSYTNASGWYSLALGYDANANGDYATAIGDGTFAQYGQFVIGQYNVNQGSPHSAVSTDDLFIIGNGFAEDGGNQLSNAFSVKWNGNTTVAGSLTVGGSLSIGGSAAVTLANFGASLTSACGSSSLVIGPGSSSVSTAYSVAVGKNATVILDDSYNNPWDGPSVAFGNSVTTYGGSVALGSGISQNIYGQSSCVQVGINLGIDGYATTFATVVGVNSIAGDTSTAVGYSNSAGGAYCWDATAVGALNTAAAAGASAVGAMNTAAGSGSSAFGNMNTAVGTNSTALGSGSVASALGEFVVGDNNAVSTSFDSYNWVGTDNLFVIGNGNGVPNDPLRYSNALVVQKNGNATFSNEVHVRGQTLLTPSGDISMGAFTNGATP